MHNIYFIILITINLHICWAIICPLVKYYDSAPTDLDECIWFSNDSCCLNDEINKIFYYSYYWNKFKISFNTKIDFKKLNECDKILYVITCHICSPQQFYFANYDEIYLCENVCQQLFEKCNNILIENEGLLVSELYDDKISLCENFGFYVDSNHVCYDPLAIVSSAIQYHHSIFLIILFIVCYRMKFMMLLVIIFLTCGQTIYVTENDVKKWAKDISNDLINFADKALAIKELEQSYKDIGFQPEKIDGVSKINLVSEKIGEMLNKNKKHLLNLKEIVLSEHVEYNEANYKDKKISMLSSEAYLNADILLAKKYGIKKNDIKYKSSIGRKIVPGRVTVKISEYVNTSNPKIVYSIDWTSKLNNFLNEVSNLDPEIISIHFATNDGIMRQAPGQFWQREFSGLPEPYLPRLQPWFIGLGKPGNKEIIFIIDSSGSMKLNNGLSEVKILAKLLLQSLNSEFKVNIIRSSSTAWDLNGNRKHFNASPISCAKDYLFLANEFNEYYAWRLIDSIIPEGGSDHNLAFNEALNLFSNTSCVKIIAFFTDGAIEDPGFRCSSGSDQFGEDSSKKFYVGDQCNYHDDRLIFNLALKEIDSQNRPYIFSFVTSSKFRDKQVAKKLSCNNEGSFSIITDYIDPHDKLKPLLEFLNMGTQSTSFYMGSPYLNKLSAFPAIDISLPVYLPTNDKFLGVAGIFLPLHLFKKVIKDNVETGLYFFLFNMVDNSLLYHPLIWIATSNKMYDFKLEDIEFDTKLLKELILTLHKNNGEVVSAQAQNFQPILFNEYFYNIPVENATYYLKIINDSTYVIGFLQFQQEYFKSSNQGNHQGTSYLHTLLSGTSNDHDYTSALNELEPKLLFGQNFSFQKSAIALFPDAFCDFSDFFLQYDEGSFMKIQKSINQFPDPLQVDIIYNEARRDIRVTQIVESTWKTRDSNISDIVNQTYIITGEGVMRVFPAYTIDYYSFSSKHYMTRYLNSFNNKGLLYFSLPLHLTSKSYSDYNKDLFSINYAILQNLKNCSELTMEVCNGAHVLAVIGADLNNDKFAKRIKNVLSTNMQQYGCGSSYSCKNGPICETKCFIVNSFGKIIYTSMKTELKKDNIEEKYGIDIDEDFSPADFSDFFTKYPTILNQLKYENIINTKYYSKSDLDCEEVPSFKPDFMPKMGSYRRPENFRSRIINFCYDKKYMLFFNYSWPRNIVFNADLDLGNCALGRYFVTNIEQTDLYLVVFTNYVDYSDNPFNILCYMDSLMFNKSLTIESDDDCELRKAVDHTMSTCPIRQVNVQVCSAIKISHFTSCLYIIFIVFLTKINS